MLKIIETCHFSGIFWISGKATMQQWDIFWLFRCWFNVLKNKWNNFFLFRYKTSPSLAYPSKSTLWRCCIYSELRTRLPYWFWSKRPHGHRSDLFNWTSLGTIYVLLYSLLCETKCLPPSSSSFFKVSRRTEQRRLQNFDLRLRVMGVISKGISVFQRD